MKKNLIFTAGYIVITVLCFSLCGAFPDLTALFFRIWYVITIIAWCALAVNLLSLSFKYSKAKRSKIKLRKRKEKKRMNMTCIFFGAAFIILGIWFAFFKGYENIRAWKAMSDDEKAKIKIAPLCRNVGEIIALCGIIFLLKGIWEVEWFIYAIIGWFIIAGLDVWYISKSQRYKK